jgi:PAS domain S-box-containing protein
MTWSRPPGGHEGGPHRAPAVLSLLGIGVTTLFLWFSLRTFGSHTLSVLVLVIPVVWSAVRFGIPGGAIGGLVVGVLSGPFLASSANARSTQTAGVMTVRGVIFVAIGVLVAILVERARNAERQTRVSQEQLDLLVRGVQDYAIFMLDPGGHVVSWNDGARRIKGYTEEEILGRHFSCFYSEEDREAGVPQQLLARAVRKGHVEKEGWRVRKDGTRFWANVVVTPLRDDDGSVRGYCKIVRDVTERRSGELRLRELDADRQRLLGRLLTTAEEERRTIAADIHDDPVQKISALSVRLDMLARDHPELEHDPTFQKAADAARVSITSLRRLMFDVHPYLLDRDGIQAALQALVARMQEAHEGVQFRFAARLREPVAGPVAHVLYRVAQEAIGNVDRHANATTVQIRLSSFNGWVDMSVKDDGDGFEPGSEGSPDGHLGLTAMRERTELAGGEWSLLSAPGRGTTIRARLPLAPPGESASTPARAAS